VASDGSGGHNFPEVVTIKVVPGGPRVVPVDSLHVKADALRGHLDALLLAVLDDGPRHGYAIIEALQARSGGALTLPTGTIYPALRRLERAGYVESTWSTVGGRERRTYQLTSAGRTTLATERSAWEQFTTTIGAFLSPPGVPQARGAHP
jgi:PadR family transcriptional regulator, regulatory protein PadR